MNSIISFLKDVEEEPYIRQKSLLHYHWQRALLYIFCVTKGSYAFKPNKKYACIIVLMPANNHLEKKFVLKTVFGFRFIQIISTYKLQTCLERNFLHFKEGLPNIPTSQSAFNCLFWLHIQICFEFNKYSPTAIKPVVLNTYKINSLSKTEKGGRI